MNYRVLHFLIFLLLISCKTDTKQQLKGFSIYLEDIGYSFYNPPRTDRGPASVFRFLQAESGKTIVSPVCKKLFQHIPESNTKLSIPSEHSIEQIKVGLAISLIQDLLSDAPKLEVKSESNSDIDVHFSGVSSVYINEEDLYNEDGHSRTITPSCFSALKRLSSKGELKDNVFVIQESIRVDSMLYVAKESNTGGAEAQFSIKKLINFKPEVNYDFNSDNKLIINEPRYVAFRAFLLKEYIDTGLTSAGSAVVKAEPMTIADIKSRLKE